MANCFGQVKSPIADDAEFTRQLAEQDVFVLPGRMFELPGWFRISLTANDEMVDRSLAGFERALRQVTSPPAGKVAGR